MKLGGPAKFFAEATTAEEVQNLYKNAKTKNIPVFVIGGGSNLIVSDKGFDGLIMRIRIAGFKIVSDDPSSSVIEIGAGEIWDDVVKRTVDMQLTGIESMSGIPGTAGATPVQNVGAYGQEIADVLQSLVAYDTQDDTFVTLTNDQCRFSYRNSIFRDQITYGRYVIVSIRLKLYKNLPSPPFYESLQRYLDEHAIKIYTHQIIRDAILAIRADKLPDVHLMPSVGSFFKNAIVESWQYDGLKAAYPDIPAYDMGNGTYKIPSGWLIDQTGMKGQLINGFRVYDKNALVLIKESDDATYDDLQVAKDTVAGAVRDKFRIFIEQEPLELS